MRGVWSLALEGKFLTSGNLPLSSSMDDEKDDKLLHQRTLPLDTMVEFWYHASSMSTQHPSIDPFLFLFLVGVILNLTSQSPKKK